MAEKSSALSSNLAKPAALAVLLAVAVMPWWQGGRDPIGWMALAGVSLIGSFIIWRMEKMRLSVGRLGWAWLGLLLWSALSLLWTVNRFQSLTWTLIWTFTGLIFILALAIKDRPEAKAIFLNAYLWIAALASLYGIFLFVTQSYDRVTSTFYLANPFAAFLLPAVIIGLWRFAEQGRLNHGLVTMINLAGFILTDSRAATLVLVIVVFFGLVQSRQTFRHWRRLVIILIGALAIAMLSNILRAKVTHSATIQGARYREILAGRSVSGGDRLYYIKSALEIWADRPLVGGGAGTFVTLHPHYQYRVISAGRDVHNFYVQTLAELGIVGFGLLTWLIIEVLMGIWRSAKAHPDSLPIALAALALIMHAGLDIDASYPVILSLLAVLLAWAYSTKKNGSDWSLLPAVALGASLVLMIPAIWLFQGLTNYQNGQILEGDRDYGAALKYTGASLRWPLRSPDWINADGVAHFALATQGHNSGSNLEQAETEARGAIQKDPWNADHYFLLARSLYAQKRVDAAVQSYQAAISRDPYDQPIYYNELASIYLQQNKFQASRSLAQSVIDLYPDRVIANRAYDESVKTGVATAYAIAGQAEAKLGQIDKARTLLKSGLRIDPGNGPAAAVLKQIGQ